MSVYQVSFISNIMVATLALISNSMKLVNFLKFFCSHQTYCQLPYDNIQIDDENVFVEDLTSLCNFYFFRTTLDT